MANIEKFISYEDLTNIPDSMLLDSETVIAKCDCEGYHMTLEVHGEVRVTVEKDGGEEVYRCASEFPDWLIEAIKKDPNVWDTYAPTGEGNDNAEGNLYVSDNNWFEMFLFDENWGYVTSDVVDAENMSPEQIKVLFGELFDDYKKQEEKERKAYEDVHN